MPHLVNRLTFEVNFSNEEDAFALQRNFAINFQDQITEAVNEICSKYSPEDEIIRIDKIEIDIGEFSSNSFSTHFGEVFKNKFEKIILEKIRDISPIEKRKSKQLAQIELFEYFIQNGTLPWWEPGSTIDINNICYNLLTDQPEIIKRIFFTKQYGSKPWLRASLQLNQQTKTLLISIFPGLAKAVFVLTGWIKQLEMLATPGIIPSYPEKLNSIVLGNAERIMHHENSTTDLYEILKENVSSIFIDDTSTVALIEQHKKELLQIDKALPDNNELQLKQPAIESANDSIAKLLERAISSAEHETGDKYFVKHAGIILFSPFLNSFFSNLGLLNGPEWKTKDMQYKAVQLLRFLTTGEQQTPEYDLVLEKIICGIAIDEPIPFEILLNENEQKEAEILLDSVITNWKAVKNTSINGLRETFLKRDGIIKRQEKGWLLQVERKTFDVLLDSIPWGYSAVSFPWNEGLIFVEW